MVDGDDDLAELGAGRRELLASYHVKAVVYPRGGELRGWIHSLDPGTEAEARRESWERAQAEQNAAFFARLQAEQETAPDRAELAEPEQADQDAADAARAQAAEQTEPDWAELDALAELARRQADDEPDRAPEYA